MKDKEGERVMERVRGEENERMMERGRKKRAYRMGVLDENIKMQIKSNWN